MACPGAEVVPRCVAHPQSCVLIRSGCSSCSNAPGRRLRRPGRTFDSGLYRTAGDSPSIFSANIGPWDQGPDVAETCHRPTETLNSQYHPSHSTCLDTLAEQVFSNLICPDLQRSLLMIYIYIQHQRDQIRRLDDQGLFCLVAE